MILKKKIFLSLVMGFVTNGAIAQFTLDGEVRPRTEYRHGFKALPAKNQNEALFTDQRTRLSFGYNAEGYKTFIQVQDIRTWGSTSQLNSTDGFFSLHQAYGIVKLNSKFDLKLGRQEIILDDHRIFGNVEWAQQARSHDAALLLYTDSTFSFQFAAAYNQDNPQLSTNIYTVPKNYKALQYLWFHKDFSKSFGMSVLLVNNGIQATKLDTAGVMIGKINYNQTVGTRLSYKAGKLKANANVYYQMGDLGAYDDPSTLNAYDLGLDVAYKVSDNITAVIGFELLSGTSQTDTANKENNSFNPLFGTNHKFNGFMDYFYVGNHGGNVGLQDVFVKIKYKNDKFNAGIDAHMFSTAADLLDATEFANTGNLTAMSAGLGTEVDVYGGFKLSKGVMMKLGYSHMIGTETMEALKGGDKDEMSNWAWAMIIIKPKFITGK